jgi:HAD superfamily hydrolase (TIGR01484 family)
MKMPLLLATDLDRTLLPNGPQPESPGARRHFAMLAARPEIRLCYVSGRDRGRVHQAIAQYALPRPDFVISDVGTSIYCIEEHKRWRRLPEWEAAIAADWAGHGHGDLAALLHGLPPLQLQGPARQNRYKLSYYLPPDHDPVSLEAAIRNRLDAAGIRARLVFSVDEVAQVGLLDVLPATASKYHALEALMQSKGLDARRALYCGDSGNDLEALASPMHAVLVANSTASVQCRARALAAAAGCGDRLYIAGGGFKGMNGNYAAGILEGIARCFPETVRWMGFADAPRQRRERHGV